MSPGYLRSLRRNVSDVRSNVCVNAGVQSDRIRVLLVRRMWSVVSRVALQAVHSQPGTPRALAESGGGQCTMEFIPFF